MPSYQAGADTALAILLPSLMTLTLHGLRITMQGLQPIPRAEKKKPFQFGTSQPFEFTCRA